MPWNVRSVIGALCPASLSVSVYKVRHVLSKHLSHSLVLNMKLFTIAVALLATAGLSAAVPTPVNGDQKYVRSVSES